MQRKPLTKFNIHLAAAQRRTPEAGKAQEGWGARGRPRGGVWAGSGQAGPPLSVLTRRPRQAPASGWGAGRGPAISMPGPGSASFSRDIRDPGGPERAEDGKSSLAQGPRTTQGRSRKPAQGSTLLVASGPAAPWGRRAPPGRQHPGAMHGGTSVPVWLGLHLPHGSSRGASFLLLPGPACVFLERRLFRAFAHF